MGLWDCIAGADDQRRHIFLKAISARRGSGKSPPYGFNIRPPQSAEHSLLNDHLRGDKPSKRSEGVPAFGLPLFLLSFLINSFLLQKI